MSKLIYILSIILSLSFFSACGDSDEKEEETKTSIVLKNQYGILFSNAVVGYFDKDGYCHKIADLGNIENGQLSKEIYIADKSINEVVFFAEFQIPEESNGEYSRKISDLFQLKQLEKNIYICNGEYRTVVKKDDPKSYPQ